MFVKFKDEKFIKNYLEWGKILKEMGFTKTKRIEQLISKNLQEMKNNHGEYN